MVCTCAAPGFRDTLLSFYLSLFICKIEVGFCISRLAGKAWENHWHSPTSGQMFNQHALKPILVVHRDVHPMSTCSHREAAIQGYSSPTRMGEWSPQACWTPSHAVLPPGSPHSPAALPRDVGLWKQPHQSLLCAVPLHLPNCHVTVCLYIGLSSKSWRKRAGLMPCGCICPVGLPCNRCSFWTGCLCPPESI